MRKWVKANSEIQVENQVIVQYEQSFSTAQIEQIIFYGQTSPDIQAAPGYYAAEEPKTEGELMLIGDELMKLDRQNFPPECT